MPTSGLHSLVSITLLPIVLIYHGAYSRHFINVLQHCWLNSDFPLNGGPVTTGGRAGSYLTHGAKA